MRILVVSQYWYPDNGIPQHRWAWLSRTLTEAGHTVNVVCPHPTAGDRAVGDEEGRRHQPLRRLRRRPPRPRRNRGARRGGREVGGFSAVGVGRWAGRIHEELHRKAR